MHQSIHIYFRRLGDILDTWISGRADENADREGGPECRRTGFYRLSGGGGANAVVKPLGHPVLLHALHTRPR